MRKLLYKFFFVLATFSLFYSCTTQKKEIKAPFIPKKFENSSCFKKNFYFNKQWWEIFNDKNLNKYLENVLKNNLDLKIALEKILIAEKEINIANSKLYPNINLIGERSKSKTFISGMPKFIPSYIKSVKYNLSFNTIYEIDIWGKFRSLKKSAQNLFLKEKYNKEALEKLIIDNIITAYYSYIKYDQLLNLEQQILYNLNQILSYLKYRYINGTIDVSKILEIKSTIARESNNFYQLKRNLAIAKYTLNVLLAKVPENNIQFSNKFPNISNLKIPALLPSQVLTERPDIKAAQYEILSKLQLKNVSRAEMFPSFTITGNYGFEHDSFRKFINNSPTIYNWVFKLFQNLIDFGYRRANLEKNKSILKIAELNYSKLILNVLKEIESNLKSFYELKKQKEKMDKILKSNKEILEIIKNRYQAGLEDSIAVLKKEIDILKIYQEQVNLNYEIVKIYSMTIRSLGF